MVRELFTVRGVEFFTTFFLILWVVLGSLMAVPKSAQRVFFHFVKLPALAAFLSLVLTAGVFFAIVEFN